MLTVKHQQCKINENKNGRNKMLNNKKIMPENNTKINYKQIANKYKLQYSKKKRNTRTVKKVYTMFIV
jgi:hypothetical protein